MLDDVPREGEQLKMRGSVMLALGESKEEVLGLLRNDVYAKSGVWDMDKVRPHCFPTLRVRAGVGRAGTGVNNADVGMRCIGSDLSV